MSFTYTPYSRTLQANTIGWYNTGITINAGQQLHFSASGAMEPWSWWNDYYAIIGPDGARWWPTNNPNSRVYMQGKSFCMLIGKIGSNKPFEIGVRRNTGVLNESGTLYLAVNDVLGTQGDNSGSFSVTIEVGTLDPVVTEPPGGGGCFANNYANSAMSVFPISLYDGEKREEVTDLVVNTPAGALQFVRSYRQNKQTNTDFQFMGLGWTHNHLGKLTLSGTSPNRSAVVLVPGGGRLQFTEDSGNAGHFAATEESLSILDEDSINSEYILTAPDKNKYVFDGTSFLLNRIEWSSNEIWTYTYASGQLSEVEDGYGRKLVFAYVNNPSQYDDGQLWRVGDHETTSLTGTPSGRYIEFGYTPEKNNGSTIMSPKALLASVRDVRGNTWTYDWYGQDSSENDSDQLNFLLKVASPSVDITGDGTPDGSIILKQLSYTLSGSTITSITQDMGIQNSNPELMQTVYDFQPSSLNETHETTAGKVTKHYFTGSFYAGKIDPAGNSTSEWLGSNYRPETRKDGNGNDVQMEWSQDGSHLLQVIDGLGNQTQFSYNTSGPSADTLQESTDAQGRKTEYTYDDIDNPRLPTLVKMFDQDEITVLRWQEFSYDDKGRVLTETVYDPTDGTTVLQQASRTYYTSGNGEGLLESFTQEDPFTPANNTSTIYTYDSYGRVIKTQQTSLLGTCEFSYTVYDETGNVVATVCGRQNVTPPANVGAAVAMYDINDPDKNRVTTHIYDTLGRQVETTVNAGAVDAQTTLTVYDALNRVIRTISNYIVDVGVSNPYTATRSAFAHGTDNNQNLVTDTAYNALSLVRKQTDILGHVTLYGYDDAERLVKIVRNASQPNYNNDYIGTSPDPTLENYVPVGDADEDIITTQAYDGAGNMVKTVDALGRIDYIVYDVLNRPIKTVRAAKNDASTILNPGDTGYDSELDPRWESYVPSAEPDRDLIETTKYDALGRVIRTQRLLENRPDEQWETTLYGYDALGRQVHAISSASQPDYDLTADPDLSDYMPSGDADQDILTHTTYDASGRVQTTQDPMQVLTWLVYDGLGRQVKTITNYIDQGEDPAEWVWDTGNNRWEQSNGTAIAHGTNNDENIITVMVYDSDGRVQETQDVLGRINRSVYDTRGRLIRTVANFVDQGEDPSLWVWNSGWKQSDGTTAIGHGTDHDENVVASTVYDAQGRVSQSIDRRNNVTQYVYDSLGRRVKTIANYIAQGSSDPADWLWDATDVRWEDGAGSAISFGSDNDQNRITATTYDLGGRVIRTRDAAGIETRYEYDALGRRIQSIANYVNGVYSSSFPDEDLISTTVYNKGGQVVSVTDVRDTETAFTYDHAGRRLTITQAVGTALASVSYTCYDKAGRVLRTIQNWSDDPLEDSPDTKDVDAIWLFVPTDHGTNQDQDLTVDYAYDAVSRRTHVIVNYLPQGVSNPANWIWDSNDGRWEDGAGNAISHGTDNEQNLITLTEHFVDGQVKAITDAEGTVTHYRYDGLRRNTRVVQGYSVQGSSDPDEWTWDATDTRWEYPTNNAVAHGTNNDRNIIVDVTYDRVGRVVSQRDPRGNLTSYTYDQLNQRTSLTNPLSKTWTTEYQDLTVGGTRVTMTYPGITGAANYDVQRDFDRLGRLLTIQYGDPTSTPDVEMIYDAVGNRAQMTQYSGASFSNPILEIDYTYDAVHRLENLNADDGTTEIEVSYEYDAGGLRTKLSTFDGAEIEYTYDERGQMVSLTDWDNQVSAFDYDQAGRLITAQRPNGLDTSYAYDPVGRLRQLRHVATGGKVLGHFAYTLDRRGNRIEALEAIPHPATTTDTIFNYDDTRVIYSGSWSTNSGFKETTVTTDSLKLMFFGDPVTLVIGEGPDHSTFDIYLNEDWLQTVDGYAASAGQRNITINPADEGPHILEIRNLNQKNGASSGYKLRFKQLVVADKTFDLHTVTYSYDALSRLLSAAYHPVFNPSVSTLAYTHTYDRAGNRTQEHIASGGSPITTNYSYNAANQLTGVGAFTLGYDNNGNFISTNGFTVSTWDRANRMLSYNDGVNTTQYRYTGTGERHQKTVGSTVSDYLLDLQPCLAVVLAEYQGGGVTRFAHGPRGILAQEHSSGGWRWMLQDGLGSVRGVSDPTPAILESRFYKPYGERLPYGGGSVGSSQTMYGFTGEQEDSNKLLYLRARHYNGLIGVFTSLDPFEGIPSRPMSLNGYSWVEGNVPNAVDPTGMCPPHVPPLPVTFSYNRTNAALSAVRLAENGIPGNYETLSFDSARFISIALLDGGFPMTTDPDISGIPSSSATAASTKGWFASCDTNHNIVGNSVWRNHDSKGEGTVGLTAYLAGSAVVAASDIIGLAPSNRLGGVNTTTLCPNQNGACKNDQLDFYGLVGAMASFYQVEKGDYVYSPGSGTTHGFMVVGKGPALKCDSPLLDPSQSIGASVVNGTFNVASDHPDRYIKDGYGLDVYYVADVPGVQRGTARPFYCSQFNDSIGEGGYFNGQTSWVFYKVPSSVTVPKERIFTPPFGANRKCP